MCNLSGMFIVPAVSTAQDFPQIFMHHDAIAVLTGIGLGMPGHQAEVTGG